MFSDECVAVAMQVSACAWLQMGLGGFHVLVETGKEVHARQFLHLVHRVLVVTERAAAGLVAHDVGKGLRLLGVAHEQHLKEGVGNGHLVSADAWRLRLAVNGARFVAWGLRAMRWLW